MEKGKYPIIANGELYVEPISKKMNFPPKEWPHDYNCNLLEYLTQ